MKFPAQIYLLIVNNGNTKTICKICLNLKIDTPKVTSEQISHIVLVISTVKFEKLNTSWIIAINHMAQ